MELGEMEERTFLASADGRRWLWDNWKGFILEGILKLTYLSTGPWLWIASYGPGRKCIVQSQKKSSWGRKRDKKDEFLPL